MKIRLQEENTTVKTTDTRIFEDEDLCTGSPTVLFADELAVVNIWLFCEVMLFSETPLVDFSGLPGPDGINVTSLEPCFWCFVS